MTIPPPISDTNWLSQMKRGLLELCLLNLVRAQPMYGYQMVKRLTAVPGLVLSEGTVYPLLARLKARGWVASSLVESTQGPARRMYVLTDVGRQHLERINAAWQSVVQTVASCMGDQSERKADHETPHA